MPNASGARQLLSSARVTQTALPSSWALEILSGPNAGAVLDLHAGCYSLGASQDDDIVLADPAVTAAHLDIEITSSGALLSSRASGVALGRQSLAAGVSRRIATGNSIALGETVIRLTPNRAPPQAADTIRRIFPWLAITGTSAALLTFLLSGASAPKPAGAMPRAATPPGLLAAMPALSARLHEAGLSGTVHLAVSAGAIVVSGDVPPGSQESWEATRRWFDGAYGNRLAMIERFGPPVGGAPPPPLRIAAVALGPLAYVVAEDGARYGAGAVLPGGWTIQSIAPDGVTLQRDGQTMRIGI